MQTFTERDSYGKGNTLDSVISQLQCLLTRHQEALAEQKDQDTIRTLHFWAEEYAAGDEVARQALLYRGKSLLEDVEYDMATAEEDHARAVEESPAINRQEEQKMEELRQVRLHIQNLIDAMRQLMRTDTPVVH